MIFKVIQDEADITAHHLSTVFGDFLYSFDNSFSQNLNNSISALKKYEELILAGNEEAEAKGIAFGNADGKLLEFLKDNELNDVNQAIIEFTANQKQSAISTAASSKKFSDGVRLINTYKKELDSLEMSQEDFITGVSKTNASLGKVLSSGGSATKMIAQYGLSLVGATAKTIALEAASMALNSVLSLGAAMIASFFISQITNAITQSKRLREEIIEAAEDARDETQSVTSLFMAYNTASHAYDTNTGSKENLESATQALLNALGYENKEIEGLTANYGDLSKAINDVVGLAAMDNLIKMGKSLKYVQGDLVDAADDFSTSFSGFIFDDITAENFQAQYGKFIKAIGEDAFDSLQGTHAHIFIGDPQTYEEAVDAYERVSEIRQSMYEGVSKGYYSMDELLDLDFFQQIDAYYNKLKPLYEDSEDYIATINQNIGLAEVTRVSDLYGGTIDSQREFDAFIKTLERGIQYNSQFYGSQEDIQHIIDSTIGLFPEYADYYQKYIASVPDAVAAEVEPISFDELIADTDSDDDFIDRVRNYQDEVTSLKDALGKYRDGSLESADLAALLEQFPALRGHTDDLDTAIVSLIGSMNSDMVADFTSQFGQLETEDDVKALMEYMGVVMEIGDLSDITPAIDINAETTGLETVISAIKEANSATGLATESMDALIERYKDLPDFDTAKLFEETAYGIRLNTEELWKLEDAYAEQQRSNLSNKLSKLTDEYNDLTRQIDECASASKAASLYARRSAILDQINDTSTLATQYDALTSSYNRWQQAQSGGEDGDAYDNIVGGLERIAELRKEGLVGTNEFQAALQLMTNQDIDTMSLEEQLALYDRAYPLMEKYFTKGDEGLRKFLADVHEINDEWAYIDENGQWQIDVDSIDEVAEAFGLSSELVEMMFRKLGDYGFDVDLTAIHSDLDTMMSKAETAAAKLKELGKTDYEFDLSTTDSDEISEQVSEAHKLLNTFKKADGTFDVNAEGFEEAQFLLATLLAQKQALNTPAILQLDTSSLSKETGETLRKVQKIMLLLQNLQIATVVGEDTSAIKEEIDALVGGMEEDDLQILAQLGFDPTSYDTMLGSLTSLTEAKIISVVPELDPSAFENGEHNVEAIVKYLVDDAEVEKYSADPKYAYVYYSAVFRSTHVPTLSGNVVYSNKPDGSTHTSMAQGTAYYRGSGDWSVHGSGRALGGELGAELRVRNGKYKIIGQDSAEFFDYRPGDIIFNAAQTEEILSKGKIKDGKPRGKALYAGNSITSKDSSATGSGGFYGSNSSSSSSNSSSSSSSNGNSSSSNSNDEDAETIDWIEIAISRLERIISKLAKTATSTFKTLANRLNASHQQIGKINQELELQAQAYNRYMQQANSVGLSPELQALVQNGTIDINDYDAETAALIHDYQQWCEAALDCADAIDDLHETLASLYEENFNAIATDLSNQLSLLEHQTNTFNNALSLMETQGLMGGANVYAMMQNVEQQNVAANQATLAELTAAMNEAVASGAIEVGSEAWYAMQIEINAVTEAIQESEIAMAEFANAIQTIEWETFDYLQEQISNIASEADFLISLMSSSDLYDDQGNLTAEGLATMGLHGINYNTYMSQADQYAQELADIDAQLAENPHDTNLLNRRQELLALQQEAILAAQAEQQAIVDLVQEGINLELSAMQELIDAYTESLDSAKDLYDYQKKLKKQTTEIANIQKQLAAYAGDTSEENRARIQKLQLELEEAQESLEETQYEQYIKDQKKLMEDLYAEYEEILNQRLDNIDALISDVVNTVNNNASDIAGTITTAASNVGYTLSDSLNNILTGDGSIIAQYGANFSEQLTTVNTTLSGIAANVAAIVAAGNAVAGESASGANTTTAPTPPSSGGTSSSENSSNNNNTSNTTNNSGGEGSSSDKRVEIFGGRWWLHRSHQLIDSNRVAVVKTGDSFEYGGETRGNSNSIIRNGQKYWVSKRGSRVVDGFSEGGYVEGLRQIAARNGDDVVTVNTLKRGEAVLTPEQAQMFKTLVGGLPTVVDSLDRASQTSKLTAQPMRVSETTQVGDVRFEFNMPIEHVDGYNDIVSKMQNDPQFEGFIQSMTIDRIVGGSKLSKNKYRWN